MDRKQYQTQQTFSYKWSKRDTYESKIVKEKSYKWLVNRYFGEKKILKSFISNNKGKKFLDAGCGSAYSSLILFNNFLNEVDYLGVDISDSIEIAKERFDENKIKGHFLKRNIQDMNLNKKFDIIFSEGVLHHTSNPFLAFKNLINHLNINGIIMFYVYKEKAPIREFTDDFIRNQLKGLCDEEAWQNLIPLTELGKKIGDLNIDLTIDEDIKLLDIKKGKYNLQRFFYWFFIKMYYDKKYSIEEMNHINFDWFRPLNCYRFKPKEIENWLIDLNLTKLRFIVEKSGITVIAKKSTNV